jgi:hypothetical protein
MIDSCYNKYNGYFFPKKVRNDHGELISIDPKKILSMIEDKKEKIKDILKIENKKYYTGDIENFDFHWDLALNNIVLNHHIVRDKIYFSYYYGKSNDKNIVSVDGKPYYLIINS